MHFSTLVAAGVILALAWRNGVELCWRATRQGITRSRRVNDRLRPGPQRRTRASYFFHTFTPHSIAWPSLKKRNRRPATGPNTPADSSEEPFSVTSARRLPAMAQSPAKLAEWSVFHGRCAN